MLESLLDTELKPDAYYTALLYAYNQGATNKGNPNGGVQVVIGDMPMLVQREMAGRGLKIT